MKRQLERLMGRYGPTLRHRRGGINFIELMVSILVITIASVAFAHSFFVASFEMDKQRRRMEAVQLAKSEAQFWVGRIHTSFPSPFDIDQWHEHPGNPLYLGQEGVVRRPNVRRVTSPEYVEVSVNRSPIRTVDLFDTSTRADFYEFTITVDYIEDWRWMDFPEYADAGVEGEAVHLELDVPFIPAVLE